MIDQAVIAVFGVAAVWLSNDPNERVRRWGPVCGLIAQPAWLWTTYVHEQWAIFALSFVYAFSWARGVRTYWIKGRAS